MPQNALDDIRESIRTISAKIDRLPEMFLTRSEYEKRHEELVKRIEAQETRIQVIFDRHNENNAQIRQMFADEMAKLLLQLNNQYMTRQEANLVIQTGAKKEEEFKKKIEEMEKLQDDYSGKSHNRLLDIAQQFGMTVVAVIITYLVAHFH